MRPSVPYSTSNPSADQAANDLLFQLASAHDSILQLKGRTEGIFASGIFLDEVVTRLRQEEARLGRPLRLLELEDLVAASASPARVSGYVFRVYEVLRLYRSSALATLYSLTRFASSRQGIVLILISMGLLFTLISSPLSKQLAAVSTALIIPVLLTFVPFKCSD